jgi:phosphoribosylcarboxyaminoimidazole (NCAIR) mutase
LGDSLLPRDFDFFFLVDVLPLPPPTDIEESVIEIVSKPESVPVCTVGVVEASSDILFFD